MKTYTTLALMSMLATGYSKSMSLSLDSPYSTDALTACPAGTTLDGNACNAPPLSLVDTDFINSNVIKPRSQFRAQSVLAKADVDNVGDVVSGEGHRIHKYTVTLNDNVAYRQCKVLNKGGGLAPFVSYVVTPGQSFDDADDSNAMNTFEGTAATGSITSDLPTRAEFTDKGNNEYECSFYLLNNEFIGGVTVDVAFEKTVDDGERLTKASLSLAFVPSATDPGHGSNQDTRLRDIVVQYSEGCKHSGGYLLKDGAPGDCGGTDTHDSGSSTNSGNVHLKLSAVFLDTRYKVIDESGAGELLPDVGNLEISASGINLKSDYQSFNGNKGEPDLFSHAGINMQPLSKANSKTVSSTITHQQDDLGPNPEEFSNQGARGALPVYVDGTDVSAIGSNTVPLADLQEQYKCDHAGKDYISTDIGDCAAQYVLNYVFEIEYGLPQFDSIYVNADSCGADCTPKLSIKGIEESGTKRIDVEVSISVDNLPTSESTTIAVKGPKLTPVTGTPIRQPGLVNLATLYEIGVGVYNLETTSNTTPATMNDQLKLQDLFSFATEHPNSGVTITGKNMLLDATNCPGLADLKLYELGTDPLSHYQRIFQSECNVLVPTHFIGTKYHVNFREGESNDASALTIIENDGRKILIGSTILNPISRTSLSRDNEGVSVVAQNIQLTLKKELPNKIIPAGFTNPTQNLKDQAINFQISSTSSALLEADRTRQFSTPTANGQAQILTLTSTTQCTGSIDLSFVDQDQYFAAEYRIRIPCSRMSANTAEDTVDIEFKFAASLDLEHNRLEVSATPNTGDNGYTAQAFFGTCNDDNTIARPNDTGGCGINDLEFVNDTLGVLTLYDDTTCSQNVTKCLTQKGSNPGLQTLKACAGNQFSYPDDNTLTAQFDVAMQYTRDASLTTGFTGTINYCDSQQFTVTVNRKKTATITAATIDNIDLLRAVIVKDIKWVPHSESTTCSNEGEYQLVILVASKDADARQQPPVYTNSKLKRVVLDPATDATNLNKMTVYTADNDATKTVLVDANYIGTNVHDAKVDGNHFKVHGQCVVISGDEGCGDADADDTPNGDSWSDYSQQFETNVVITGEANAQDVDTKVKITLSYESCPVGEQAVTTGKLQLGLQSSCKDAQNGDTNAEGDSLQSISQPTQTYYWDGTGTKPPTLSIDCTIAFSDDVFQVSGDVFSISSDCDDAKIAAAKSNNNADGCGLLEGVYDTYREWVAEKVDVKLTQFSTESGVDEVQVGQTAHLCKCNSTGCAQQDDAINSLPNFVKRDEVVASGIMAYYLNCGEESPFGGNYTLGDSISEVSFLKDHAGTPAMFASIPLAPLAQASEDLFKVEMTVVLKNTLFPARRRLLRATHKLRSTASSSASTPVFHVLESSVVEESNQEAPAPDAPEQPVEAAAEEPASEGSSSVSAKEEVFKIGAAEGSDAYWALAGIIIASIWLILEIVDIALRCGGGNSGPSPVRAVGRALGGSPNSYTRVSNPVFNTQRSSRFSNLRY